MILVFKTSVRLKREVQQLKPHLDKLLIEAKLNFDLKDCDNILRIETQSNPSAQVIRLLHEKGFLCEELTD